MPTDMIETRETIIEAISRRAESSSDHPALVVEAADGGRMEVSYGHLMNRVEALSAELLECGLTRGDRCGLISRQGMDFIVEGLAVMGAGLCLVPLSDDSSNEEREEWSRHARLHGILNTSQSHQVQICRNHELMDKEVEWRFKMMNPAYLRFTSGTTNERKGVVLSHGAIMERLDGANKALKIGSQDRILWLLPMAHHWVVSILLYLRQGATILLPLKQGETSWNFAAKEQATVMYASPHDYGCMVQSGGERTLTTLRLAISTAVGLDEETAKQFLCKTGVPLSQALGIIEMGLPVVNLLRAKEKPLSVGQVVDGYHVGLFNEAGDSVTGCGREACGEVFIKGPGSLSAYLDPWMESSAIIGSRGFATGDQGYFDQEGDLHLLGRRGNRIHVGGMKFFSEEVEAVINSHPEVMESRVRGEILADEGEVPVVDICLRTGSSGLDLERLKSYCKEKLSRHKIPQRMTLVNEIPKTPTGKIRRW